MFKHTFAVCAYKKSPFLETCIKSLLNQTVKSNIIIVTSTPCDYINEIAKKYNLKVLTHEDGGIANDWNFGMSKADSEYCTLAHQDDVYRPEYLENCLKELDSHENSLIAFTDYNEIVNDEITPENTNLKIKKIMLFPLKFFKNSRFIRRNSLSLGNCICCPAVTYNLKNIGKFKFDSTLSVNLDWEAWERISKLKGRFCYINKPLMMHRIHSLSETTNAIGDNRRSDEDILMLSHYWGKGIAKLIFKLYSKGQDSNNKI